MKSLYELCRPRKSVFDPQKRDTVLDLTDLVDDRIEPGEFFTENYITEGMKTLLAHAFLRLEGKTDQGVFKLKQAMGGGKTHNLLALGLLARHPEFRDKVMGGFHKSDPALGSVKVVAFTGRESDAPLGVWGALAEQLGKKEHFKDCYSPLQAPGQKAWENLFAGQTALVLLDELPPYFENARSKAIGNSDLAQVTATALSNLLVAIGRPACSRVCLVISDLTATYQKGTAYISTALKDLEAETHRGAMELEPVRLNSDELYHILRTRIFEALPADREINEVAGLRQGDPRGQTDADHQRVAGRIRQSDSLFLSVPSRRPRSVRPLPRESRLPADPRPDPPDANRRRSALEDRRGEIQSADCRPRSGPQRPGDLAPKSARSTTRSKMPSPTTSLPKARLSPR